MRKKVSVHDLRLGMYVADLDRPWRSTRFLYQGFEIDSQTLLDMLKQLCQFVYSASWCMAADTLRRKLDFLPPPPSVSM